MEGLGVNLGYLIVQIGAILILYLMMKALAFGPITRMLEQRQARIAKGLEDARQASIARDNADVEAKKILEEARTDSSQMRSDATVQAEDQAKGIVDKANQDAKDIVSAAQDDAIEERNRILAELRTQVATVSIAAANKVVGESLDEKRQHEIIADFFAKAPVSVADLSGESAAVTSALPLTKKEQSAVEKAIGISNVDYNVDPEILGGLIIRAGDQVVDDSVASRIGGLRESLLG